MIEYFILKDGEPCDHKGCAQHVTHPCEKCGRIGAKGEVEMGRFVQTVKEAKDRTYNIR